MNTNYQYWRDQQMILERKQKKLSFENNKVNEAEEDDYKKSGSADESKHQSSGLLQPSKYSKQSGSNHKEEIHSNQPQSSAS